MRVTDANRRWWVLAGASAAIAMSGIDTMVVSVALPEVQRDLGASLSDLQWVMNAYLLVGGALILVGGRLGDVFGRRSVFLIGVALFTLASVLAGLADSNGWLIGSRGLQGVGAALMLPGSLSLVQTAFPDPGERTKAIGIWTAVIGASVALGPLVGGVLTDGISWRAIFFINVPIAAIAIGITLRATPESRDPGAERRIDLAGLVTITGALFCLMLAIIQSSEWGWGSARTVWLFAGAAVLFAVFIAVEARVRSPLIDLRLYRDRTLAGSSIASSAVFFALFGWLFFFSLFIQYVLDNSPAATGVLLLPASVAMTVAAVPATRLNERLGPRVPSLIGTALAAVGLFLLATLSPDAGYSSLWLPFLLVGGGVGMALAPLNTAAIDAVPADKAGAVSGLTYTVRWVGGALGVAVSGAIFRSLERDELRSLIYAAADPLVRERLGGLESLLQSGQLAQRALDEGGGAAAVEQVVREVFVHGLTGVMLVAGCVTALAFLASLLVGRPSPATAAAPVPTSTDAAAEAR